MTPEQIKEKRKALYWSNPELFRRQAREWGINNPEKRKLRYEREKVENADVLRDRSKRYRESMSESQILKMREHRRKWREKNKDYGRKWAEKNAEKMREYRKVWEKKNNNLRRKLYQEYRARIRGGSIDGTAEAFYQFIRSKKRVPCYYCGEYVSGKKAHIDHVIAVARQGNHASQNLCASCPKCNYKKGKKLPSELKHVSQPLLNL